MICEFCGKEHDGSYGSGRFCCQSCSRRYSSLIKKDEKNRKISKSLKGKYKKPDRINICEVCGKEFVSYRRRNTRTCSLECKKKLMSEISYFSNIDWDTKSKLIKDSYESGKNYVAGGTTKWISYKNIKVQGSYELRVCKILDKLLELGKIYKWEYTKDRIPYIWKDGSRHTYLLDFKVYESENKFYYIESKGYIREHDEEKWEAAKSLNLDHRVWFLGDIEKYERYLNI